MFGSTRSADNAGPRVKPAFINPMRRVPVLLAAAALACAMSACGGSADARKFSDSVYFQNDRLLVVADKSFTYINSEGEFALGDGEDARFSEATVFGPNGRAIVKPLTSTSEEDALVYHIIDTQGRTKAEIDMSAYAEDDFLSTVVFMPFDGQGCALFYVKNFGEDARMGMVDETGRVIIAPEYDMLTQMSAEGVALGYRGKVYNEMTCDRIDRSGRVEQADGVPVPTGLALMQFDFCPEEDGLTPAYDLTVPMEGGTLPFAVGYLNASGEWAIAPQYAEAGEFAYERAVVFDGERYHGIDMSGSVVFSLETGLSCGSFTADGLAWLRVPDADNNGYGNYGFIDRDGNIKIVPTLSAVMNFSNGFAAVAYSRTGGYAYIGTDGVSVTAPVFHRAKEFDAWGFAAVQPDDSDEWIYIDSEGQQAVPGTFYSRFGIEPTPFDPCCKVAIACVEEDGLLRLIDANGEQVGSAEFTDFQIG